jgi:hypothetical protein
MFIGWLTCIPAVLLPHSLCRCATANTTATRPCPQPRSLGASLEKKTTITEATNNADFEQ